MAQSHFVRTYLGTRFEAGSGRMTLGSPLRGTTEVIEDTEFISPICDWNQVKTHFPETDEEIDARIAAIRP